MSRYIPLSTERFGDKRWTRFTDYRHAQPLHLVPIMAPEVSRLAGQLPLVFARDGQGKVSLCALTGLTEHKNHCLNGNHRWQLSYVPAFLRTHPFRLMAPPKGKGEPNQRVLCVDVESPWVGEQGEEAFLEGDQPTALVQETLQALGKQAKHFALTERACQVLMEAEVLTQWPLTDHKGQPINGLLRLDEGKLAKVTPETLAKLHKSGALAMAYAQAISTHQLAALKHLAETFDADYRHVDLDSVFGDGDDDLLFDFDN
ncbi:SapC family protein [Vreelandella rituensis]|uniref:SapC family protein n=1 Tax=Vreelandella rituensis TaxID=2282306 RepID=A0A368TMS7_9GAMM|nr:SapC family protein [Halomonas rituensis]RCV85858.1 hypothetical protein DU506_19970 [Halomonas rituensis]